MLKRNIEPALIETLTQYPVAGIIGPRQSGKTKLVKTVLSDYHYVNLEDPDTCQLIMQDPRGFFSRHPQHVIFDEVQRLPELLSYIQTRVDESNKTGQFVITGSHQLALHEAISQSLAGRIGLLDLLPLSLSELNGIRLSKSPIGSTKLFLN